MLIHEDNALTHFGVKGMKWGKRKAEGGGDSAAPAVKPTRKELRVLNKKNAEEFYQAKARMILEEAAARPDNVLVKVGLPGDPYPTVTTGRQFVEHLSAGGVFDIKRTNIWARKNDMNDETEPWELDPNYDKNMVYKKVTKND